MSDVHVASWLRPADVAATSAPELFDAADNDTGAVAQVVQGDLEDCWFLGAASTMRASHDADLRALFVCPEETGPLGAYIVRFWKLGRWHHVLIDSLLPCDGDRSLVFGSCSAEHVFWLALLEKAFAKLHGSYSALAGGSETDALADLSGGVSELVDLRHASLAGVITSGGLWASLVEHTGRGGMLGCSSQEGGAGGAGGAGAAQRIDAQVHLGGPAPAALSFLLEGEPAEGVAARFLEQQVGCCLVCCLGCCLGC